MGTAPDRNQPRARFVRTVLAAVAGYAVTWGGINWGTDYIAGGKLIAVNLVAALVTGAIAYVQALRSDKPRTTLGKVVATFLQNLGGGLATVTLAAFTFEALVSFGRSVATVAVASFFGALATLGLNAAENQPPPTG